MIINFDVYFIRVSVFKECFSLLRGFQRCLTLRSLILNMDSITIQNDSRKEEVKENRKHHHHDSWLIKEQYFPTQKNVSLLISTYPWWIPMLLPFGTRDQRTAPWLLLRMMEIMWGGLLLGIAKGCCQCSDRVYPGTGSQNTSSSLAFIRHLLMC